jgi:hypothetical protein
MLMLRRRHGAWADGSAFPGLQEDEISIQFFSVACDATLYKAETSIKTTLPCRGALAHHFGD